MPTYFAYYRVSTQKQGASGLGLEAQQSAVVSFLKGDQPQAEYIGGTFNQKQVQRLYERVTAPAAT